MKEESRDLDTRNEFHYIRPTAAESAMAKEDPLRPYGNSNRENLDGRADSTMILRPKSDIQLEVEKKNSGLGKKYVKIAYFFPLIPDRANDGVCRARKSF